MEATSRAYSNPFLPPYTVYVQQDAARKLMAERGVESPAGQTRLQRSVTRLLFQVGSQKLSFAFTGGNNRTALSPRKHPGSQRHTGLKHDSAHGASWVAS